MNNNQVSEEKVYPSKIAVVYPEGSLHLKLAIHAFNNLDYNLEQNPQEAEGIAKEFGVTVDELFAALEDLYTEN